MEDIYALHFAPSVQSSISPLPVIFSTPDDAFRDQDMSVPQRPL